MPKYTCPNGHWWKQEGGKGICICGEKGKTNATTWPERESTQAAERGPQAYDASWQAAGHGGGASY